MSKRGKPKPINLEQVHAFAAAVKALAPAILTVVEAKENEEAPGKVAQLLAATDHLVAVTVAFVAGGCKDQDRSGLRWALIHLNMARHAAGNAVSRHSYSVFHHYGDDGPSTAYRLAYEHTLKAIEALPAALKWYIEDMFDEDLHESQEWFEHTGDSRANPHARLAITDVADGVARRARAEFPSDADFAAYEQQYAQQEAQAARTKAFVDLMMNTPVEELHAAMDHLERHGGSCCAGH